MTETSQLVGKRDHAAVGQKGEEREDTLRMYLSSLELKVLLSQLSTGWHPAVRRVHHAQQKRVGSYPPESCVLKLSF